ncbi:metacaspase-1-like [Lolium rigidum]|uniref:metacaspase-1-like n=1 Tax=Lolium rigidum TaxID=89674 RepID=UPI001F5D845C|nr:metacaspase-1-like [Lolium rigidum]
MECGQCGAGLSVPRGARSVQCAHCRGVTRVQRHGAVGVVMNAFANMAVRGGRPVTPPRLREAGYPRVPGDKRALLIGINYTGTENELSGPINDVKGMSFLLTQKYGFPKECILTMTDEERDPYRRPTKSNILLAMRWLVHGCRSGDSLVFHFSGMAGQMEDEDGDEQDGEDQTIFPLDWELNGEIRDDEINDALVRPLVKDVTLHAVIDACHSGTMLDLPNIYKLKKNGQTEWKLHTPPNGAWKNTSGGMAILISGCGDNQMSTDGIGDEHLPMGVLTYSFVTAAFFAQRKPTYAQLLATIKAIMLERNADSRINCKLPAPMCSLVRKVVNFSGVQEPQLSSSQKFDINREHFEL